MPVPIHTPRLNNNDDSVRLSHVYVAAGSRVRRGEALVEVETDKATFTVEAEQDGYFLGLQTAVGDTIDVGSILAWLAETADEPLPVPEAAAPAAREKADGRPTLKAAILLARHKLSKADVPVSGERLSAQDVEAYIATRRPSGLGPAEEPGRRVPLTPNEHGVLRAVAWQAGEASPAYVEVAYDPEPWATHAAAFQKRHGLLMSPLLPLLAWRVAQTAAGTPALNATLADGDRYCFDHVNLGFTVQSDAGLFVVVVREAETLDAAGMVRRLGELQRAAMRNALRPQEAGGATVGFSSMARWNVTRHVPVLLPRTALMVAHSAPAGSAACLGATYDHRVLTGADVARALLAMSRPPDSE